MTIPIPAVFEQQMVERFLDALRAMPEVWAEVELDSPVQTRAKPSWNYDARIGLRLDDRAVTLWVEVRKSLYPRDVRQILWRLKELRDEGSPAPDSCQEVFLLLAESFSPGAKDLLRKERVGYYDSGGSLFLSTDGIYLRVDKPAPKSMARSMRSLFSKRRAQVLHALLIHHTEWFGVTALADQSKVSAATVSEVLMQLERFDWLTSRGKGPKKERCLREPAALLDTWIKQLDTIRQPTRHRFHVPSTQPNELIRKMGDIFESHSVEYAITHEAAGQCYAPFLTDFSQVHCRLLPDKATDRALKELDARTVSEGGNLTIIEIPSPDELLLRKQVDGVWLASPIQVYLDLMRGGDRSKEIAEHLRREKIGF